MNEMLKIKELPETLHAHAVKTGNLIFTTGQLGRNPVTKEITAGMENQARQALANLRTLAESQGLTLNNVARMTIYVSNLEDMPQLNKVYFEEFFPEYRPARTCVQVARIARDALLELDAVLSCGEA